MKYFRFMALLLISATLIFSACNEGGVDGSVTTPVVYAIGDTGPSGVGIVFYITDGGLHGLEVAPVDQSTGAAWSTITNAYANGSSALPDEIGTGSANTDAIIGNRLINPTPEFINNIRVNSIRHD